MKLIGSIFLLIGMGLLIGSFFAYQNSSSFLDAAIKTEGTVIELIASRSKNSTTYKPLVQFTSQTGEVIEFTSPSGSSPPSYAKGEKVEILYLPEQPQKAEINDFFSLWGVVAIVGGLGGIFFLIGAGMLLTLLLKGRREEYLKTSGIAIQTEFQRVQVNKNLSVNGKHPFRIISQWQNPETLELYVFESNDVWFDPSNYLNDREITVFIERGNPKKYYVDISFLPRLAN